MRRERAQLIRRQDAGITAILGDIDKGNWGSAPAVINLLARVAAVVRAVLVQVHPFVFIRVVRDEDASGGGGGGGGSRGGGGGRCGGDGADRGAIDRAGGRDGGNGRDGRDAAGAFGDTVASNVLNICRCALDDPAEVGVRDGVYFACFCGSWWGRRGGRAGQGCVATDVRGRVQVAGDGLDYGSCRTDANVLFTIGNAERGIVRCGSSGATAFGGGRALFRRCRGY